MLHTVLLTSNNKGIVIITNKVAATSYFDIIEDYMKNLNDINSNNVMSSRLPQPKSYLKILGIPYFVEDTNLSLTSNIIKVLETTHIFNNVV